MLNINACFRNDTVGKKTKKKQKNSQKLMIQSFQ